MTTSVYEPHPVDGKYHVGKTITVYGMRQTVPYTATIELMWNEGWAYVNIHKIETKAWLRTSTLDLWN
jgi:hypothetical protein